MSHDRRSPFMEHDSRAILGAAYHAALQAVEPIEVVSEEKHQQPKPKALQQ